MHLLKHVMLPKRVTNEVAKLDGVVDSKGVSEDDLKVYPKCLSL